VGGGGSSTLINNSKSLVATRAHSTGARVVCGSVCESLCLLKSECESLFLLKVDAHTHHESSLGAPKENPTEELQLSATLCNYL